MFLSCSLSNLKTHTHTHTPSITKLMAKPMETMMMSTRSTENPKNPTAGPIDSSSSSPSSWKLYDNPHYSSSSHKHHPYSCLSKSTRSSYHTRDLSAFARPMDRDVVNLSDLDNALAEIKDLRAEIEFERRMRRKVEALNRALARELEEERRAREASELTRRRMAEEIASVREEAERAAKAAEDERRMLRAAEAMREGRVQMKMSEARFAMEEKIKEMLPAAESSPSPSPSPAKTNTVQKREVENPHIKRGIKGMEFPRAVRVRAAAAIGSSPREGRGGAHLGNNLECQRAQMRVLMRHKNPAATAIVGAENLVM